MASPTPTPAPSSGMTNNVAAALVYIPFLFIGLILGIVFLVIEPYNKNRFVRFHAFQSIFLHVGIVVLVIGWQILMAILGLITHGLALLVGFPVMLLFGLAAFVLMCYMAFQAYNNKETKLPFIGELASKQAGA